MKDPNALIDNLNWQYPNANFCMGGSGVINVVTPSGQKLAADENSFWSFDPDEGWSDPSPISENSNSYTIEIARRLRLLRYVNMLEQTRIIRESMVILLTEIGVRPHPNGITNLSLAREYLFGEPDAQS